MSCGTIAPIVATPTKGLSIEINALRAFHALGKPSYGVIGCFGDFLRNRVILLYHRARQLDDCALCAWRAMSAASRARP